VILEEAEVGDVHAAVRVEVSGDGGRLDDVVGEAIEERRFKGVSAGIIDPWLRI